MGNNKSRPSNEHTHSSCGECNCASEVPRVIAACNSAGENAVTSTLEETITGLVGKESSNFIMKEYSSAINNSNSKWVTDYNKIKESYNNFEGFIEGNEECIHCDCIEAANSIIQECQNSTQKVPATIGNIINDKDIQANMNKLVSPILDSAKGTNIKTDNDWKNIFQPSMKESFTEGYGGYSTNLYTFTGDALNSRWNRFKDEPGYRSAACINAFETIKGFVGEELKILESLYYSYITFVKNYTSLYFHRESHLITISNRLDELKKIQTKIDSYKTNLHVDNRKNLYQTNNYDFYTNIRFYMLIVYYSIFIIYLIFSKFFIEKQYTNKLLVLILFIYLIMPIILENIIHLAYKGYIYFLEYNNLKEDAKSYEDIINKNST